MKILVTGATGFIGSHLVRLLAGSEHDVCCLVRETSDAAEIKRLGARLRRGDVTDRGSVAEGMAGNDCVVHLANVYSMWEPDKSIFSRVNVGGTRNVMECALEAGVIKVIHVSTAGTYGKPRDCPFTEESEIGPARFSEYARTKHEGELLAWDLFRKRALPLVVISPGAVLGLGDTKPTGRYIEDLATGRMPVTVYRDVLMTYVHVKDVAEAIRLAIEHDGNVGQKYLVGKEQLSFGELNELIRRASGVPLPRVNLPDSMVRMSATVLTSLAAITRRPPLWGMSVDQAGMAREGFRFDGSKAERELRLRYSPISAAIEETIASIQR